MSPGLPVPVPSPEHWAEPGKTVATFLVKNVILDKMEAVLKITQKMYQDLSYGEYTPAIASQTEIVNLYEG